MTTSIDINANHGWPVRYTALDPVTSTELPNQSGIVKAGDTMRLYVHSTLDYRIHEIKPSEAEYALHLATAGSGDKSKAE
jgi:hypothetical protein